MARKLTQEEFESKVFDIFGDEYTVLGKYVTRKTEILVKHNKCGDEYYVNPNNLLQGKGHFKCNGNLTKTTKQFKQEVLELFNGEYEVLGEYKNNRIKIQMKHNKCGNIYLQIPKDILNGHGCPYCGGTKKITHFEYELKFNEVNNGEYELVGKYNGMGKKLCIKHKKCGNVFEMRSVDFLNGQRCPNCRYENTTKTHNEFIEEVLNNELGLN